MAEIKHDIEVDVPVRTAYNQFTQFETFPEFMDGVERVEQRGDYDLYWKAEIAGVEKEWNARIVTQEPDRKIAWQSVDGPRNNGTVKFREIQPDRTRVTLEMEYEPEDLKEKVGDALGVLDARVKGDLKNFKEFIEERGHETGAYRGRKEHGGITR